MRHSMGQFHYSLLSRTLPMPQFVDQGCHTFLSPEPGLTALTLHCVALAALTERFIFRCPLPLGGWTSYELSPMRGM